MQVNSVVVLRTIMQLHGCGCASGCRADWLINRSALLTTWTGGNNSAGGDSVEARSRYGERGEEKRPQMGDHMPAKHVGTWRDCQTGLLNCGAKLPDPTTPGCNLISWLEVCM